MSFSKAMVGRSILYLIQSCTLLSTTSKVVWRSLVNVNVKTAVRKLKEITVKWTTTRSVDDASKQVIEIVNSATSILLDKADDSNILRTNCRQSQTLSSIFLFIPFTT